MRPVRGRALVSALLLVVSGACESTAPTPESLNSALAPLLSKAGVTPIEQPAAPAPALVRLGQALFFDKILSGSKNIGCSTCHNPVYHTSDQLMLSIGTGGTLPGGERQLGTGSFTPRHAFDLFDRGNPAWHVLMWDGRVASDSRGLDTPLGPALPNGLSGPLAAQALLPLLDRVEMRGQGTDDLATIPDSAPTTVYAAIMARLRAIPGYDSLLAAAYPGARLDSLRIDAAVNAIAAFITDRWTTGGSPFDQYLRGDTTALDPSALRGALLFFGSARCAECHRGPLLTDQAFHNTGVPVLGPGLPGGGPDVGRAEVTGNSSDRFLFRTPPLRNVGLTGPYTHNGSFATLEAVVRHYRNPEVALRGFDAAALDPRLRSTLDLSPATVTLVLGTLDPRLVSGIALSDSDVADLTAFLLDLTDPASTILLGDVPPSVPSGLPVADY
ncbi:MAG TPA: cytochrome c peroxidase [Gemmatimonadales bacterium]|nr:cytochrome c peroxidase [Gemmatimonadales bacterium]